MEITQIKLALQYGVAVILAATFTGAFAYGPAERMPFGERAQVIEPDKQYAYVSCSFLNSLKNRTLTSLLFLEVMGDACSSISGESIVKINLLAYESGIERWKEKTWVDGYNWTERDRELSRPHRERDLRSLMLFKDAVVEASPKFIVEYNAVAGNIALVREAKEERMQSDKIRFQQDALAADKRRQANLEAEEKRWQALSPAQRAEENRRANQQRMAELGEQCRYWSKFMDSALESGDLQRASNIRRRMNGAGCP